MIEIHEAMRLQVIVESDVDTLTKIYNRQPALQELVGNGWVLVTAVDPETGVISNFNPEAGFVRWQGDERKIQEVRQSSEWYDGHLHHLPTALISQEHPHV